MVVTKAETPGRGYSLVPLRNGTHSVRSLADAETFHPGIGPVAEAEALYVRQLQLPERVEQATEDFIIWDVGLGAAANALTAIRAIHQHLQNRASPPKQIRIVSFDQTLAAAQFALQHAAQLEYLPGYEPLLISLLKDGRAQWGDDFLHVEWLLQQGDFPALLSTASPATFFRAQSGSLLPHAILFDPHSPRKNPAMWTVSLFTNLFRLLAPGRPCALANFTRSTMARAAMLLGGFYVGVGHPSGLKEETTMAANSLALIREPLDHRWLERAKRSDSAEPLDAPHYRQAALAAETLARLAKHPQFSGL